MFFFFTIFQMKAFMVLNIISLLVECIASIIMGLNINYWRFIVYDKEICRYIESSKDCYCYFYHISGNLMQKMKFSTFNKSKIMSYFF